MISRRHFSLTTLTPQSPDVVCLSCRTPSLPNPTKCRTLLRRHAKSSTSQEMTNPAKASRIKIDQDDERVGVRNVRELTQNFATLFFGPLSKWLPLGCRRFFFAGVLLCTNAIISQSSVVSSKSSPGGGAFPPDSLLASHSVSDCRDSFAEAKLESFPSTPQSYSPGRKASTIHKRRWRLQEDATRREPTHPVVSGGTLLWQDLPPCH